MQVLLAVIVDLYQFTKDTLHSWLRMYPAQSPYVAVEKTSPTILNSAVSMNIGARVDQFQLGKPYFIGQIAAYLYAEPVKAFDTIITDLPYGTEVLLEHVGGRWAGIRVGKRSGFVLKDYLFKDRTEVYPQFFPDQVYDVAHPETIKLRWCINDAFAGARAYIPLVDAEYVTYALSRTSRKVPWQSVLVRPRLPGAWQILLRGLPGITMSVVPRTGAIMEYVEAEVGHLAYVKAVYPDKRIEVEEVGVAEVGQFTRRTITKDEYKELRPVFIMVD